MIVVTGPPGSGKTRLFLEQIREALRDGRSDFRLLVPTATMAEHLRNELAREGFVFRPPLVSTLTKFVEPWVKDLEEPPRASLELLAARVIEKLDTAEFRAVADLRGFRACVAALIEEIASAGYDSAAIPPETAPAFLSVFRGVEADLRRRNMALRGERLLRAASRISAEGLPGIRHIFLDGFFSFARPELAVIDALRRHADVSVSLPDWPGSEASREALGRMGLSERATQRVRPRPKAVLIEAATVEQEVEEIIRRILTEVSGGRLFREIGIVVRSRDPYVPIFRAALGRAGIPARFYFAEPLAGHPLVRYLSGAIDAMLGGWDFEETLEVVRLAASGCATTPASDRFEFKVREALPGQGIDRLTTMARERRLRTLLERLASMEAWRDLRLTPGEWAEKLKALSGLIRPPRPEEAATHETALTLRSYAAALEAFHTAMREAAGALDTADKIPLQEFWEAGAAFLRLTSLRTPDHRRNVVHVLDVYEARQWDLPVVFVCGLVEKQFPLYHAQNPLLPDEPRRRLRDRGVFLRTTTELDLEEDFLFDIATTRATSVLALSFPKFGRSGDANLRSFHINRFLAANPDAAVVAEVPVWRLDGPRARAGARAPVIYDAELREWLEKMWQELSPSGIETFLQCPFQFFSRYTLQLAEPPADPAERLDALVQGRVLHDVLAELVKQPQPVEELFRAVFEAACAEANVVRGYRTEAVRIEMLRNLLRFVKEAWLGAPPPARVRTEHPFCIGLHGLVNVRGRIDRADVLEDGRVLLIDYKYSSEESVRKRVKEHSEGRRVQGGLYMRAARQELGEPAGFLFAALRGDPGWHGWHAGAPGLEEFGTAHTAEEVQELADRAAAISIDAARQIREGRIAAAPADSELCPHCEFFDVCRVETATRALPAERGEG